jgi:hypothetical protein
VAKATKVINRISFSDEERRRIELEDIKRTLLENKEVIKETFDVVKGMQDRVDCSRSFSCNHSASLI